MSTYYAISTSHPEVEDALRQVNEAYAAIGGRHWPYFSADKSMVFLMVKPFMPARLKQNLAAMAIVSSDDHKQVFEAEFNGEQPRKEDVKELLAGRKTVVEIRDDVKEEPPKEEEPILDDQVGRIR